MYPEPRTMPNDALQLCAATAADMMTANPISLHQDLLLSVALKILMDREIGAAPVIDEAGRAVGVLSRTDLLRHERDTTEAKQKEHEFYHITDSFCPPALRRILHAEPPESRVKNFMTPAVLSVAPTDPAVDVVAKFLAFKVHRLFVVDASGVLVGVVSALDVLRHLRRQPDE